MELNIHHQLLSSITLQPSKLFKALNTFSRENDFSNCIFTDSECETEIGNLTHVAVKSIYSSKIFFVSLVIFNSSFV